MPSISAFPAPVPGYVYVETNWSDIPRAAYVNVDAVDGVTGARRPLRGYVSYDSEGRIALSCGQAIFWDTEASLDRSIYYCATAYTSAGAAVTLPTSPLISATFSTVTASSWPAADTGQAWTNTGGAAADYSGTGSRGQHAVTSTAVNRVSAVTMTTPNFLAQVTAFPVAVALTQATEQWMMFRADAAGANGYKARLRYNTGGTVDLILERVAAGVPTVLVSSLGLLAYAATTGVALKVQAWGSTINVKAWDVTTPEPSTYTLTITDTTYSTAGTLDLVSLRNAGNTNGTVNMQWDNLTVFDVCNTTTMVQVCSQDVVVPSGGWFRFGNPTSPCGDQIVYLSEGDECDVDGGVFFGNMATEAYADSSGQFLPVNARRPVVVARDRRDVQSTLTLVTRTFADRNALLTMTQPGTPLLIRGPASYGIPDRYMSVADVSVERPFSDHQIEPRVFTLPHWAVDAPVGPTYGVCGTRIQDLCDVYPTWDAVVAAGLTYPDLLRGKASDAAHGATQFLPASWTDVNTDFANWTALQANESDWDDTMAGFP